LLLVCIPEDMAVEETLETASELQAESLPFTATVANQIHPAPFPRGTRATALRLSPQGLARSAKGAGIPLSAATAKEVLHAASTWDARVRAELSRLRQLQGAGPVIELPFLYAPAFGPSQVSRLADVLVA